MTTLSVSVGQVRRAVRVWRVTRRWSASALRRCAARARKHRIGRGARLACEPTRERRRDIGAQGRGARLPPFAGASNVRACVEGDVLPSQSRQLAIPQPRLCRDQQEHALTRQTTGRLLQRDIAKEAVQCGVPLIACARVIVPIPFEVDEKRFEARRIEVLDLQGGRGTPEPCVHEAQEQPKRVAVRGNGVPTRVLSQSTYIHPSGPSRSGEMAGPKRPRGSCRVRHSHTVVYDPHRQVPGTDAA